MGLPSANIGRLALTKTSFFPLFSSYIYRLCSDQNSIEYSTKAVLDDFEADGVIYLELRTTPRAIPEQDISKDDYVNIVLRCLDEHMSRPQSKMKVKLILSVDRRWTSEAAQEVVDLAIKYRGAGVVGVDLCGDPTKGDITIFKPAFIRAREAGLYLTLHFAEFSGTSTEHELSNLLSWGPSRLGHVVHVNDHFKKCIIEKEIGVELCLSCNVQAKMIEGSFPDHHFGWWKSHAGLVALCVRRPKALLALANKQQTDDVGVFCSPLSEEYLLAVEHFQLTMEDVKALCVGAINHAFATVEEKLMLQRQLDDWFKELSL